MNEIEFYNEYKGIKVTTQDGCIGTIIGYYKSTNQYNRRFVLLGIGSDSEKQGWKWNGSSDLISNAVTTIPIPSYRSYAYYKIDSILIDLEKPESDNTIEQMAEEWIKSLKSYNDMDEDSCNLLLNGFIAGGKAVQSKKEK